MVGAEITLNPNAEPCIRSSYSTEEPLGNIVREEDTCFSKWKPDPSRLCEEEPLSVAAGTEVRPRPAENYVHSREQISTLVSLLTALYINVVFRLCTRNYSLIIQVVHWQDPFAYPGSWIMCTPSFMQCEVVYALIPELSKVVQRPYSVLFFCLVCCLLWCQTLYLPSHQISHAWATAKLHLKPWRSCWGVGCLWTSLVYYTSSAKEPLTWSLFIEEKKVLSRMNFRLRVSILCYVSRLLLFEGVCMHKKRRAAVLDRSISSV